MVSPILHLLLFLELLAYYLGSYCVTGQKVLCCPQSFNRDNCGYTVLVVSQISDIVIMCL